MTVQEIFDIIDRRAPFALQESWDRSGLLVGDPKREVQRVLLTLDITTTVIKEAAVIGADLILSHHPVIFQPFRQITPEKYDTEAARRLLKYDMAAMITFIVNTTCVML